MKHIFLLFCFLTAWAAPALGQEATVVQTCGTLPLAYAPGSTRNLTVDVNGKMCGSNLATAVANMTFNVATTGSDSNPCTSGSPCLTIQHAVNVAAGYNWVNKYVPTINVANGTYTGTQVVLPALVNLPNSPTTSVAQIIGNTTTPTNVVVSDAGTQYTFQVGIGARWNIKGFSFGGTYGGLYVHTSAVLFFNNMNWGGALANMGIFLEPNSSAFAGDDTTLGGTFTTSASTMGEFIFSRGVLVLDSSSFTFSNAITVGSLFGLDFSTSQTAADGVTFTNASNVTATNWGLIMNNGAFFETATTTKVDGATLTRTNFPGGASGAKVFVDGWSVFQGDLFTVYATAGTAGIVDTAGILRADYNFTTAGVFTVQPASGSFTVSSPNTSNSGFQLANTSTGGHALATFTVGSGGLFGMSVGNGALADVTNGNLIYWFDNSANMTFSGVVGFSALTAFTANAKDAGVSRLGAASLALGNGTAGDFTGTLKLAHLTASSLANTATTSAVCYNTSTGVLTYDGTIGTCTTSDERLKNMGERIPNALDKLLQINGVYGTWKNPINGRGRQIFIGAQTAEKVFPELVQTDSEGKKVLDYQKLTAPIIEALRELKADNDNLKAEIKSLKSRRRHH